MSAETPPPPPLFLSTQQGYDRWSEIYDVDHNPLLPLEEPEVQRLLGPPAELMGRTLLDVGCGTGRHTLRCAAAGAQVTALDFSAGMLKQAQSKEGAQSIRFIAHDLTQPLPLADHSFELALCCLVLDHIPKPQALLSEIRRVLVPGGVLVLSLMHPALLIRGVEARFTQPDSGQKICPKSYPHRSCDYVMAILGAGLTIEAMSEHSMTAEIVAQLPRAERYLGWPMVLMFRLRRPA